MSVDDVQQLVNPQDFGVMNTYSNDGVLNRDLLALVDPTEVIERIEHELRGEKWDPQKRQWVQIKKPLLNEYGISQLMYRITDKVNTVFNISNFDDNDVQRLAKDCRHEIIDFLAHEFDKIGVREADMTHIVVKIDHYVYAILRQAYADGTRKMLTSSYHIQEQKLQRDENLKQEVGGKGFGIGGLFR